MGSPHMSKPYILAVNTETETYRAKRMKKNRLTKVVKELQHKIRTDNDRLRKSLKNGNSKHFLKIRGQRDRNVNILQIYSAVLAVKLGQQPRSQLITIDDGHLA